MIKFKTQIAMVFLFGFSVGLSLSNNSNSEFNSNENSITIINSLRGGGNRKYPRNFDKNFHRIVIKEFSNSKKRIEFEKSQLEFYNSARSKLYRAPNLSMKDKMKLLSPQEHQAINYFTGQCFYSSYQHFRTKPNIFYTRESFLINVHDECYRNRFLTALKEFN